MKNMTLKRGLALVLALVMMLAMAACAPAANNEQGEEAGTDGKVLGANDELSIIVGSHASWPYDATWKFWDYFKEAVGGNITVSAITGAEFDTKVNLMMTSQETLPDLLHLSNKNAVNNHATSGAFISIDDNIDKMPNYTKFIESLDPVVAEELVAQRVSGDGKLYFPPVYGSQAAMNFRIWMYRKDIFEKHGLEVPTNLDEMYEVAKKLKELYPDSYPLCFRSGLGQFDIIGSTWKNDFYRGAYYDFQTEEWKFGGTTDTMKEMVLFFKKMKDEGLVPADFLTITTGSWEELVSNDKAFMMPEYLVRITYFNVPNQQRNPEYEWAAMAPPALNADSDHHKIAKVNLDMTGFTVPNTGKEDRIENAIKVLDWMYSDEAKELLSWGKEGETYVVNEAGEKEFIKDGDKTPQLLYGATTYGLYQVIEEAAFNQVVASGSEIDPVMSTWTEDHANPTLYLSFNDEESAKFNELHMAITSYSDEMISKFIDGTVSIDKWDEYVAQMNALGVEEYLDLYEGAHNRTLGK